MQFLEPREARTYYLNSTESQSIFKNVLKEEHVEGLKTQGHTVMCLS